MLANIIFSNSIRSLKLCSTNVQCAHLEYIMQVQVTEGTPTWHSCVRMMDSCSHTHVCRHSGLNLSIMQTFVLT